MTTSSIKILHLEDQASDADLVARTLKKGNIPYELKLVSNREDYTEALTTYRPEVIISDHNLPAFNSIEALNILNQSKLKIPFILVTGTVSEEFAVEAMRAGADDYILKDRLQRLPVAIYNVLEKYRLEKEKIKSEALLRNIDANSLDLICSVSEKGYFLHASAASETILGYTPAELIGKKISDFVYEEDKQKTIDSANYVMSGNLLSNFENRYVRKDGSLVTLSWSTRWDDQDRVRYGVARDVTAIKKLEYAHRQEQQRFIDLFLEAPAAIGIVKGPTHVYQLVNPLYQQFTGRKDVVGKTVAEVFPELESQGLIKLLDKVYQSGRTISRDEVLLKMYKDDSGKLANVYCNYVVQPYRNEQGEVEGVFFFSIDVTEQVLSRQKIEANEKRYRQIVETAQEGIWVTDEHDTTTFVNNKLCEILEYTREEIIGKKISSFMDDEGIALGALFSQKKNEGLSCQDQIKFISKTGREMWTNVSANSLFNENGVYGGVLSMVTDITQQKEIEEENKKLSDVASLTVNAVIVADTQGRITWVNKGFERITEYTLAEVVGQKPGHILQGPNTDKTTSKYMGECVKKGQGFRVELINYGKSGREYWLDIEVRPLHNSKNKLTGFMAIEQDITERKKYEETLVRRDNQLTLAASIARLGYWEYDVMNDLFTFNDQFYDVFKTTAEVTGGYTMRLARYMELFVHPDDKVVINKAFKDAIESVEADFSFKGEHRIVYSNSEIGFISIHFKTIKNEQGRTIKYFGVNQDITERKTVELERLALIDGLQNKNRDLQQFSYIVSHNLRAPIAKIMGLVNVMESESVENEYLIEKLNEEATHLDNVVKDINTIVSARKSTNESMELVSLETKLNLIKQVLEDQLADSKATIVEDFSAVSEIWTIKSYLYSILYNLISNAIKYKRTDTPPLIEVKSCQDEKFICLSVKDNGEGIDLEKNGSKLFGLYKRFHTGSIPGKGIGLHLVKTHAESLGGRVEIDSELGAGTTFRVYIPKLHDSVN